MKQWELYGITDGQQTETVPAEWRTVNELPMVLWTTDQLLQFTCSPATGLLYLGLGFDPLTGELLDVFGPEESGVNVIDAHEGALGGSPAHFELRGRDRTVRCWVSPLTTPDGRITGTICIALDEAIEAGVKAKRTPMRLVLSD
jgi:hypothetical protein